MSKMIRDTGKYFIPAQFDNAGDEVSYPYEFTSFEDLQDAVSGLGEETVFQLVQEKNKINEQNNARAKEKAKNGHSTKAEMSPETKAKLKAKRAENNALLKAIADKGLTVDDILNG